MKLVLQFIFLKYTLATSCIHPAFEAGSNWRELSSPFWPHGIESKTECEWTINAPVGKRVQVHFDQVFLSNNKDEFENCLSQSIDLIDGAEQIHETDYISFCGEHRPSIDFISSNETMRILLNSNLPKKDATGEERFLIKFRSTEESANFEDHVMGTVRMEKSGGRRFRVRALRRDGVVVRGIETGFGLEDGLTKLTDSTGRMRSRVKTEYDPDVSVRRPVKKTTLLKEFDASENLENVEGGGKMLAIVACGSIGFLLLFAVASVYCFKNNSKAPLNETGAVAYCKTTKRYVTVNA